MIGLKVKKKSWIRQMFPSGEVTLELPPLVSFNYLPIPKRRDIFYEQPLRPVYQITMMDCPEKLAHSVGVPPLPLSGLCLVPVPTYHCSLYNRHSSSSLDIGLSSG